MRTLDQIDAPPGFERVEVERASVGRWLRGLPLAVGREQVRLFDGRLKPNQNAHYAVLEIDVGSRNLQQCADAAMRLWAEYLWQAGRWSDIGFDFTSGDRFTLRDWLAGKQPRVEGNRVTWVQRSPRPRSYTQFRKYLRLVFAYAGSYSLSKELQPLTQAEIAPGDVFIRGGFPGHAVIVVDVVANAEGERRFMLAQSYMPAQDIHILVNPADPNGGPWYDAAFGERLITPEWVFDRDELMRHPALTQSTQ